MKEAATGGTVPRWGAAVLAVLIVHGFLPDDGRAVGISGRISAETVSYGERISSLNGSTSSLKLYATIRPREGEKSFFVVDAERRYYDGNPELGGYRCRSFFFKSFHRRFEFTVGRQYILEAPGTTIDGLHLKWKLGGRFSAGFFGGLKAETWKQGMSADRTTFGVFGSFARTDLDVTAGYVSEFFEGRFNRSYLDMRVSYRRGRTFRFYGKGTIDTDDSQVPSYLTRLYLRIHSSPRERLRFSLLYSRYQAYQEFAFPDYAYLSAFFPTHRFSLGAQGKLTDRLSVNVNGGFNYRTSNHTRTPYGSITLDARGLLRENQTSYVRLYRSWGELYESTTASLGISQGMGGGSVLRLSLSHRTSTSSFGDADAEGWFASGSVRSVVAERILFNLTYNYDYWDDLVQNGLYASLGYRF